MMQRAMTSPKRGLLFSIAVLTALALGGPSGALAETGLDASSPAAQPDGVLVAQWKGIKVPKLPSGPQAKQVPDVTGQPQGKAKQVLSGAGFKSVVRPVPTRDRAQEGKVKRQRPPAGQMHPLMVPVALEVWALEKVKGPPRGLSGGEEPRPTGDVKVPDVVSKRINAAGQALLRAGLRPIVGKSVITDNSGLDKMVESQSPGANRTVPAGTRVTMNVYQFKAEVNVPPVRGMPVNDAVDRLRKASLKSKVVDIATGDSNKHGIVGAQAPIAGKMVPPGTLVTLGAWWYQAGSGRPSQVNTPSVIGMTKEEAEKALTDAGFGSRVRNLVLTEDKNKHGRVEAQGPPPGTPVTRGTTVTLDVWNLGYGTGTIELGPTLTITGHTAYVPDVTGGMFGIGMTKAEAEKVLRDARLESRVKLVATGDKNKHGWVKAQAPPPGTSVDLGTTVTLDVWKFVQVGPAVPNVTRMKMSDAKKKLKEAGYKPDMYSSAWVHISDESLHCKIQKTSPPAGTSLRKGETVWLSVWTTDPEPSKKPGYGAVGYAVGSLIRGKIPCWF